MWYTVQKPTESQSYDENKTRIDINAYVFPQTIIWFIISFNWTSNGEKMRINLLFITIVLNILHIIGDIWFKAVCKKGVFGLFKVK